MKKKNTIYRILTTVLFAVTIIGFSAQSAAAQCGTYFKTKHRKIQQNFSPLLADDWTGDGRADMWKFENNINTSTKDLVIYANNGNGEFNWDNPIIGTTTIPAGNSFPILIDYNSDGKKDLFFTQGGSSSSIRIHTIHINNGNNSFTALTSNTFDEPDTPFFETLGFIDVNSDSVLDWIRLNGVPGQGNSINYRLGNANGTFGAKVDIVVNPAVAGSRKRIGDFTGDGKKDIVYGYSASVLINNGNGTFTAAPQNFTVLPSTVTDINSDGKDDMIDIYMGDNSPRQRYLVKYKSSGDGNFVRAEIPVLQINSNQYTNFAEIKVADFNGDGFPDILEVGESFYSIHLNNGAGEFSRTDYQRALGEFQSLIFAEFNGDNKTDILDKSQSMFAENVIHTRINQCESFGETKGVNFDGRKSSDLLRWNPNTGVWSSHNSLWSDRSSFPLTFTWGAGSLGDIPAPGDYDGDGKTDYAVFRNSTGDWYIRQSSNSSLFGLKFGATGDIPIPGDYNGGGKTDIAVFRPSEGNWYIWFAETQQSSALHFGANGDKPVAQDFDGDGKTDIAVFRPENGVWYYLRSSDQNVVAIQWGIGTDKIVPADYDGDGRADLAIYRAGIWYILRSSNNAFVSINWGVNGDIPIPFYENGESAALVVYRPSTFGWHKYGDSSTVIDWGESGSAPVYFGLPNN